MKQILFSCLLGMMTIQATAQLRLTASSDRYGDGSAFDSTSYKYKGKRIYLPEMNTSFALIYGPDTSLEYSFNNSSNQYEKKNITLNNFDTDGHIVYDVSIHWSGTSWDTLSRENLNYVNQNQITETDDAYNSGLWNPNNRIIYSYDTNNNVIEVDYQNWNNQLNTWDSYSRITRVYNGNLLTVQNFDDSVSTGWAPSTKSIYHYNAQQQLDSMLEETYNYPLMKWDTTNLFLYYYDLNGDMDSSFLLSWNVNTWGNANRDFYTSDNNHNQLSDITQMWQGGQYVNSKRESTTYNASNLPTHIFDETWNTTTNQFNTNVQDLSQFYYYELNTVGVEQLNSINNNAIELYPNPASNTLNIRMQNEDNKIFSLTIYDMTGKVIRHWYEPGTKFYAKSIDVSDLADGTYIIKNCNSQAMQKFSIIR